MKHRSYTLLVPIYLLLLFTFCLSVEAKDKWISVRSKNFFVVSNSDENSIRQVTLKLEQFREAFIRLFPNFKFSTPVPTTVIAFKDEESYSPFKDDNTAGYFQPGDDINYITLTTDKNDDDPFAVIYHEYVHLLINNSIGENVPAWFNEGTAEYYSTVVIENNQKVYLGNLITDHLELLRQEKLLPLRTLFAVDHDSPYYNEKEKKSIFYAQSWLLVHYLTQKDKGKRLPQLTRFLELYKQGIGIEKAFTQAFQMTLEGLEDELKQYVKQKDFQGTIALFEKKLEFDNEVKVTPLSDAEANAYLGDLLVHLDEKEKYAEAENYLKRALALEPNLTMARASLGMLRVQQNRFSEARAELQKAIASNSQNYLAHYYFAVAVIEQNSKGKYVSNFPKADADAARSALKKAIDLSPTFPDSYRELAFINLVLEERIDESIELLKKALNLLPGNQSLSLMLARCYIQKRDAKTAKEILDPIARTAIDAETKDEVRIVLEELKDLEDNLTNVNAVEPTPQNNKDNTTIENPQDLSNPEIPKLKRRKEGQDELLLQTNLRKPQEGEEQVRGTLIKVDCISQKSVILIVKANDKLYKLHAPDFGKVNVVSFTSDVPMGQAVGCGVFKYQNFVIATFRPTKEKNAKYDGIAVSIEFVTKEMIEP